MLDAGVQKLRLRMLASGFNVNKMTFRLTSATAVEDEEIPAQFVLGQNYPNPFNPVTTIEYEVPEAAFVTLAVFNAFGQQVATLVARRHAPGRHSVDFDARALPSGAYFYRLTTPSSQRTRPMLLLK